MFSLFKTEIKLVCFDIDNTLCDFSSAETAAEVFIMELLVRDIKRLQSKNSKNKHRKKNAAFSTCSPFTIMKIFNDVKNSHMHHDSLPERFSRSLWFKETLERLDSETSLGISMNGLIKNVEIYEKKYWDFVVKETKNYPNAIKTLESLKSKGLKLATITDSDGKKEIKIMRIRCLGIDKYFDYLITGDDTGVNKPAVENWNYLLKVSGLKAKQCMMVGDHPDVDLVSAKKLGFITVWTKENLQTELHQKYVDYEIRDIKEIVDIVKKINS